MNENDLNTTGQLIRKFRKRLGLNQGELAQRMGFNSAETISQLERGDRDLKASELARIAGILLVAVSDLFNPEELQAEIGVLWRETPETGRGEKEARFLNHCRQYAMLEGLTGKTSHRSLPMFDMTPHELTFQYAGELANTLSLQLDLGNRPATLLEKTLENVYGVKIWYDRLDDGSAASTIGPFGPAILMNANEPPWRRNYNFAHELFHLITWKSFPVEALDADHALKKQVEKVANGFASCLLLPADSIILEFKSRLVDRKIAHSDLIDLARSFAVSTEALVYRLINLGVISQGAAKDVLSDANFRFLDRSTMAAHWEQPRDYPERFVRLAFLAYQQDKLSIAKFAQLLNTSIVDLEENLQSYGLSYEKDFKASMRTA